MILTFFTSLVFAMTALAAEKYPIYPSCLSGNGYLEKQLKPGKGFDYAVHCVADLDGIKLHGFEDLHKICRELSIASACIYASLENGETANKYGVCRKGVLTTSTAPRPCLSEGYHFFTYMSYTESMDCLGLDAREFFPLINHESHFHVNVESGTGAWGVGQLTSSAIGQVNFEQSLDELLEKPSCKPLQKLLRSKMSESSACDRFEVPKNPGRNFLYAGAYYLSAKKSALKLYRGYPDFFETMSAKDQQRTYIDLARLMYNGGPGGISQLFNVFMRDPKVKPLPLDYEHFMPRLQRYLKSYYGMGLDSAGKPKTASKSRREEVGGYLDKIQHDLAATDVDGKYRCSR